jgi:biotin transport system permease protein
MMLTLTWPETTRAHGWPAGGKMAALAAGTVVLFTLDSPLDLGLVLAGLGLLAFAPGRGFGMAALAALRPLWPFVLVVSVYHLWLDDPRAGVVIILRLMAAVMAANLVTMTTPLSQMLAVFDALLRPLRAFGLNPRAPAMAFALVIRFIPVTLTRAGVLADAWSARSPRRPGWRIIGPVAISTLDDAAHVGDALRARGGLE